MSTEIRITRLYVRSSWRRARSVLFGVLGLTKLLQRFNVVLLKNRAVTVDIPLQLNPSTGLFQASAHGVTFVVNNQTGIMTTTWLGKGPAPFDGYEIQAQCTAGIRQDKRKRKQGKRKRQYGQHAVPQH